MPEVSIDVDLNVYRMSVVKKAAYRIGDRCSAKIETAPGDRASIRLTPKSEQTSLHGLEADFLQELLDQDLRESIAQETERVRNLLMAQAFSGFSADETADYRDDPLGIGRPQTSDC